MHLRDRPIPILAFPHTTADFHLVQFDSGHAEHTDPLVPIDTYGVMSQPYAERQVLVRRTTPPLLSQYTTQQVWARRQVAQRLQQVNASLAPLGYALFVKDAYRPLEVQQEYWAYFIDQARQAAPEATPEDWQAYACQYCSDPTHFAPDAPASWPLHSTGGAVDVTLVDLATGEELFMEEPTAPYGDTSHSHYYEKRLQAGEPLTGQDLTALANRRVLYHAMLRAGFTNYPHEWWHYDYGTAMHGLVRAFHGHVEAATSWYAYTAHPER